MSHGPAIPRLRCIIPLQGLLAMAVSGAPLTGPSPGTDARAVRAVPADTAEKAAGDVRSVDAETLIFPLPGSPDRPLRVLDSRLADRILDMAHRSRKWRQALRTIREERFPVLIGTIVQVEREIPALAKQRFDGPAAAWLFSDDDGRPVAAAVTVNLPMLAIRSRVLGNEGVRLRRMLDLHLAHEIYGHLAPIVATGDPDHPCRFDPRPGDPEEEQRRSCVMRRESELLLELGYEPRDTYLWDYWEDRIERRRPGKVRGSGPRAGPARGAPPLRDRGGAWPVVRRPDPGD